MNTNETSDVLQSALLYPPPRPGVDYHILDASNKIVDDRLEIWINFPVAFCREAMNWKPHYYQEELLSDESYFIACAWSRQTGKSEAIAHKAIHTAFTKANSDVLIVAPGRRQAYELYEKIIKALRRSPLIMSSIRNKPTKEKVEFLNGSRIINLPAGDEGITLRGYSIALLILEECAYIPEAVIIAVEQGLVSSGGKMIAISTPAGRNNFFYKIFNPRPNIKYDMSREGRQQVKDWSCYRYSYKVGLSVNKVLDNGEIIPQLNQMLVNKFKEELPDWRFRTEYLAEFVEDIDSYFLTKTIENCFNPAFKKYDAPPDPNGDYYFGIDIAKGGDMTSLSIGWLHTVNPKTRVPLKLPHLQIVQRWYWKIGKFEKQYPLFLTQVEIWRPKMIFFDETGLGARPYEELRDTYSLPIEGVTFTGPTKVKMYGTMTLLMNTDAEIEGWNKRYQSFYDQEAINQFQSLVYEVQQATSKKTGIAHDSGGYSIYAGSGHDDIPDSDALLCKCVGTIDGSSYEAGIVTKPEYREEFPEYMNTANFTGSSYQKTIHGDNVSDDFFVGGAVKGKRNPYTSGKKRGNPYSNRFDRF